MTTQLTIDDQLREHITENLKKIDTRSIDIINKKHAAVSLTIIHRQIDAIKEVVRAADGFKFQDALNRITKRQFATDMRPIIMLHRTLDFVFNNSFTFTNRYDSEEDFFKKSDFKPPRLTIRNLVPSIYDYQLSKWDVRGKGSSNMQFLMGSNERMKTHLSEMPVGTYKLAHKHGAGAHLYIVSGQGYSLLWPKGRLDKRIRLDWQAGSLIGVISSYFHQHFNSGPEPARYQGLRLGGTWSFQDSGEVREEGSEGRSGMLQIEIEDEDPLIRKMFEETLRKTGVQSRMPPLKK